MSQIRSQVNKHDALPVRSPLSGSQPVTQVGAQMVAPSSSLPVHSVEPTRQNAYPGRPQ